MKICFISPKAYPLFNDEIKATFGGAEVQLSLLAKEMAKNETLNIHFMVADYGQDKIETYSNVKVWKAINFKQNILSQIFIFFNIFRQIDAQVYIQRTLTLFSGIIALYCKLSGKQFIYMISSDREVDGKHEIFKNRIKGGLATLSFKFADSIVCQNEYQYAHIKTYHDRAIIVKSCYPINQFGALKNRKYHLWVGRSNTIKRPELLLTLALQVPTEQFLMICPKSTQTSIKDYQAFKIKTQDVLNITFIDFVPFKEIDQYFQKAKSVLNTSILEGFPNTFIQAAKNGVPILSLNVNPNNFLTEHQCGFYCQDDMELLKNNLLTLATNKDLYQKMSANAYKYAKDNHDIQLNTQKLLDLIK